MANNNRWGDFKGWVANAASPRNVYNTYTNTWAPPTVTATRLGAGVAGMLGPAGTLLGAVGTAINNRSDAAQQFDAGRAACQAMDKQFQQRPEVGGLASLDVPNANIGIQSQWGSINGGLAGLAGMGGGSNYGPYQGGYQFGAPQPTTSGLPNTQTTYGVSLPNYGGSQGPYTGGNQAPQGPQLTPQQQAEADRIANNNRYQGPATFASPNARQAGGDIRGFRYEN